MRKILGLMVCIFVMFSGNCFAMQFSQPVEIGRLGLLHGGGNGVFFNNASYNDGDIAYRKGKTIAYGKGLACFGNGADALYVHYDYYSEVGIFYFGGKDIANTVSDNFIIFDVFKINTDEGITIYPLYKVHGPEFDYFIVGRRADGRFVKYIDTRELTKRYFGWDGTSASPVTYHDLSTQGNALIMKYQRYGYKQLIEGTFYFKWDDNAQWFGVEQGTETVIRNW